MLRRPFGARPHALACAGHGRPGERGRTDATGAAAASGERRDPRADPRSLGHRDALPVGLRLHRRRIIFGRCEYALLATDCPAASLRARQPRRPRSGERRGGRALLRLGVARSHLPLGRWDRGGGLRHRLRRGSLRGRERVGGATLSRLGHPGRCAPRWRRRRGAPRGWMGRGGRRRPARHPAPQWAPRPASRLLDAHVRLRRPPGLLEPRSPQRVSVLPRSLRRGDQRRPHPRGRRALAHRPGGRPQRQRRLRSGLAGDRAGEPPRHLPGQPVAHDGSLDGSTSIRRAFCRRGRSSRPSPRASSTRSPAGPPCASPTTGRSAASPGSASIR